MRLFGPKHKLWGVSLGAGILGAVALAVRYARRPPPKSQFPEIISPAIFATRLLYTSRGQIVYHESGQGDPLVFVHGVYVGASSYEWSKVYPHFADRFQVLALDLLGFGESDRSDPMLSLPDQVQALREFVRAKCGGVRATIVASGLGAGFSTVLAAQHPELVQRLILSMPAGLVEFGRQRLPNRYRWISKIPLANRPFYRRYLSTRVRIRAWLKSFGFADPMQVNDEVVDALTSCAQQFGAERVIFQWLSRSFSFDLEERLAELSQPVTLVWADKAIYPPLEWAYQLQPIPKQCSLVVLQKAGLLAPLETPQQMIDVLARELDSRIRVFKAG
jgi:pimeloyl-ACP methyl ester carboxylesterase